MHINFSTKANENRILCVVILAASVALFSATRIPGCLFVGRLFLCLLPLLYFVATASEKVGLCVVMWAVIAAHFGPYRTLGGLAVGQLHF